MRHAHQLGRYRLNCLRAVGALGLLSASAAFAALPTLNISYYPLFLGGVLEPNLMLMLDDSNSMAWSCFPDSSCLYDQNEPGGLGYPYNPLAYNPLRTYDPPLATDGISSLPNSLFGAAPVDGYAKAIGVTLPSCSPVDLENHYKPTWTVNDPCGSSGFAYNADGTTGTAAYYAVPKSTCAAPKTDPTANCYEIHAVGADLRPPWIDDGGNTINDSLTLQQQNFANWYTYYRTRILAAKGALADAFSALGTAARVGYGSLNDADNTIAGAVRRGIRIDEDNDRTALFTWLYGLKITGTAGTPLWDAYDAVGTYFKTAEPWLTDPLDSSSSSLTCRQSYQALVYDSGVVLPGSRDIGTTYYDNGDGPPFADTYNNTLADLARYYYKNDLSPTLGDYLPKNPYDAATWQHLVTFAVGYGLPNGQLPSDTVQTAFDQMVTPPGTATFTWPDPSNDTTDAFIHAAVNSHGAYVNLTDPQDLSNVLTKFSRAGAGRASSAASVVLNAATLSGDLFLYQALFDSRDWSGQLKAYQIGSYGTSQEGQITTELWDAADKIPTSTSRHIYTINTSGARIDFLSTTIGYAGLTAAQVNYLRGDRTGEGTTVRKRGSLLGDIVNAAPVYVGAPNALYPNFICDAYGTNGTCTADAPEKNSPYATFRTDHTGRSAVVYAGANDGMLHAFDAVTGGETFAYVPRVLYPKLAALTSKTYGHDFYVDGTPTVVDAFFNGGWHTVLVAGLGGGGQGVYALDITDPSSPSVLWEFGDQQARYKSGNTYYSDLGFTYSRPNVVRLTNGKWVVMFGNGFNNTYNDTAITDAWGNNGLSSKAGEAVLYIVDLATGQLLKPGNTVVGMINTGKGSTSDPTGGNRPNGLATVAPVDMDGDFRVDYVYAGDYHGRIYRFDLTDVSKISTSIVFAPAAGDAPQSVTTRPQVIRHPTKDGLIVLFGTGSYFLTNEGVPANQTKTQAFYGIWDNFADTVSRSNLVAQEILAEKTQAGAACPDDDTTGCYRITTTNTVDWTTKKGWYLNLFVKGASSTAGERQISDSIVRGSRVVFSTLIPEPDACGFGGTGWLMELDAATGSAFSVSESPFLFKTSVSGMDQYVGVTIKGDGDSQPVAPSGRRSQVGIVPTPAVVARPGGGREYKYLSGSTANSATKLNLEVVVESAESSLVGRKTWSQLFR
jgi:type IV pilus assembly protein PilY1